MVEEFWLTPKLKRFGYTLPTTVMHGPWVLRRQRMSYFHRHYLFLSLIDNKKDHIFYFEGTADKIKRKVVHELVGKVETTVLHR